jgi:hypothetical protein
MPRKQKNTPLSEILTAFDVGNLAAFLKENEDKIEDAIIIYTPKGDGPVSWLSTEISVSLLHFYLARVTWCLISGEWDESECVNNEEGN